jgi:hypothetical protein
MTRRAEPDRLQAVHRKLIAFDDETWHVLNVLARDTASSFQELADEAFRDCCASTAGRPTCAPPSSRALVRSTRRRFAGAVQGREIAGFEPHPRQA